MIARVFLVELGPDAELRLGRELEHLGFDVVAFRPAGFFSLCNAQGCRCGPEQRCADILVYGCDCAQPDPFLAAEKQVHRNCKVNHIAMISHNWTAPALMHAIAMGIKTFSLPLDTKRSLPWFRECRRQIPATRVLTDWYRGAALPGDLRAHLDRARESGPQRARSGSEGAQSDPD